MKTDPSSQDTISPQEWAEMNASAQADKQRETLAMFVNAMKGVVGPTRSIEDEKRIWRNEFAAGAIASGKDCSTALKTADEMIEKLYGEPK